MMETPRPTIVISGLEFEHNKGVAVRRKKQMKQAMPKLTRQMCDKIWYVLNKYRVKQRKMIKEYDVQEGYLEDPSPYDECYVFYCFKGSREE
jgi:predicted methyltransferase